MALLKSDGLAAHLLTAVITAGVTLGGSFYQFKSKESVAEVDRMSLLYERVTTLEATTATLMNTNATQAVELNQLENENKQLKIKVEVLNARLRSEGPGVSAIYEMLDSLDVPAWCKEWVGPDESRPGHFVMGYINDYYELKYKISRAKYVGSSDFEVHPYKIATEFDKNDLRAYMERGWQDFAEEVRLPDGTFTVRRFWKFYHAVPEGPELICGWEIP